MTTPASSCRHVLTIISGYLDGETEAAACDAVERHCLACPSCAALVRGLRETVGLCRQVGSMPLPAAVRQRAQERVRELLDRQAEPD